MCIDTCKQNTYHIQSTADMFDVLNNKHTLQYMNKYNEQKYIPKLCPIYNEQVYIVGPMLDVLINKHTNT